MKKNQIPARLNPIIIFCIPFLIGSGLVFAAKGYKPVKYQLTGVVNINEATIYELKHLPKIGLKKALAIVTYRQKKAFAFPQEIMKVKGIGAGLFKKLQAHIVISGKTTLKRIQIK